MNLGWKRLLMPIALGWLVLVALVRGVTQFVQLSTPVLFSSVSSLPGRVIIWVTDKPEQADSRLRARIHRLRGRFPVRRCPDKHRRQPAPGPSLKFLLIRPRQSTQPEEGTDE